MSGRPEPGGVGTVTSDGGEFGGEFDGVERVEREITVLLRRTLEALWSEGYGDAPVDRYTYPVLALLDQDGPLGLADLAARLGLSKPTVSRLVARLAGATLVGTRPDPRQPRAVVVALTDSGAEQVGRVRAARRRALQEVLGGWPDADRNALALLLGRLNAELDDPGRRRPHQRGRDRGHHPRGAGV